MTNLTSEKWIPHIFEADGPDLSDHQIETERLLLRPVTNDHSDGYADLLSDPEVMQFVGLVAGQTLSREEAEHLVSGAVEAWSKRGYGRWSIFERESNAFVGFTGFRCEEGVPEFICLLHRRFWGRGIATEASVACLDYGFAKLGFTEVSSYCRPTNVKASRLLERLGSEFIGLIDFHGVEGAAYRFTPKTL